jgi:hypothetical protein
MSDSNSALRFPLTIALFAFVSSCARAPEWYSPPLQVVLPSGPEASVPASARRMLLAMSDPDVNAHILRDVYAAPDGAEWRFTGLHPAFRFSVDDGGDLDFYIRFRVSAESLLARGPVEFAVDFNGHAFRSYRFAFDGDMEYRHPIPEAWIEAGGQVDISLDVDPPWRLSDGTVYGLHLHSIGFERRGQ